MKVETDVRNPFFGNGYFFRGWRMRRRSDTQLEVTMEDPSHALALLLDHDGERLTGIRGRWRRAPLSSCAGAGEAIEALIGCPITDNLHVIAGQCPATLQCTHMLDSARLGIVHLAAGRPDRRYDVVFPDTLQGNQPVALFIDGEPAMELAVSEDSRVLYPEPYAGIPLFRGLARWAHEHLDAREYERIFMIQRAAFVSRGAIVDTGYYVGRPGQELGPPEGTCFGSQPERYAGSVRNPTWRPALIREEALTFGYDNAE